MTIWANAARDPTRYFSTGELADLFSVEAFAKDHLLLKGGFDPSQIIAPTPSAMAFEEPDAAPAIEAMISVYAGASLMPISYTYENNGQLAINVVPNKPDTDDRISLKKSTDALSGHTDAAFNPSPLEYLAGDARLSPSPEFLLLAGIRNPGDIPTKLASLTDVLSRLDASVIDELRKRQFILSPQSSFTFDADDVRLGSVLWEDRSGRICCRFSHKHIVSGTEDLNSPPERALRQFADALAASMQQVIVAPGDVLLINNRTVIHGREALKAPWNPAARWLLRMYGTRQPLLGAIPDPLSPWILM